MLLLTAAWTMLGVALFVFAPLTAPVLLPFSVVAPLIWYWSRYRHLPQPAPSAVTIALLLAGIYLLINASWSPSRASAYTSVVVLFLVIWAVHLTQGTLQSTASDARCAMAVGLVCGVVLSGALLCFEAFSQQAAKRLLMSFVPAIRVAPHEARVEDGWVTFLEPYLLNRSITALSFLFWPALLVLGKLDVSRRARVLMLAGLAIAPATIFASKHATSKIAFTAAAVMYAVFQFAPVLGRRLAVTGWSAAVILAVPLAALAFGVAQLHLAPWLPQSAQHRIVIWGYTSEQIGKAPLLGAGLSATRALTEAGDPDAPIVPGTNFRYAPSVHSHNVYLQAWQETGAVGALFLLAVGLLVLRALARAEDDDRPCLFAAFTTCAVIGASGFSLWQPWFLASLGFAAIFGALGPALSRAEPYPGRV